MSKFNVGDEVWVKNESEYGVVVAYSHDAGYLVSKYDVNAGPLGDLQIMGIFKENDLSRYCDCRVTSLNGVNYTPKFKIGDKEKKKNMIMTFGIRGIYPNYDKGVVVVKFNDNEVVRLHCDKDDSFDINVAVALALAYRRFGSKNAFRKIVAKLTKEVKTKEKKDDNIVYCGDLPWGEAIRLVRKHKNLSIQEVAKKAGVGASTISNAERGIYPNTTPRVKNAIEKALNVVVKE